MVKRYPTPGWRSHPAARAVFTTAVVCAVLIGGVLTVQRFLDGPYGPLAGGALRSGELVTERVQDWRFAEGRDVELELSGAGTSRITGLMVHDGVPYIPCDLGYMWGRFEGLQRAILNAIYLVKSWHLDAERDGRAVLRIDGKRYPAEAVRVTDPELIQRLKAQLEEMAAEYFAPQTLGPAPTSGPRDIWFFRLDPR